MRAFFGPVGTDSMFSVDQSLVLLWYAAEPSNLNSSNSTHESSLCVLECDVCKELLQAGDPDVAEASVQH